MLKYIYVVIIFLFGLGCKAPETIIQNQGANNNILSIYKIDNTGKTDVSKQIQHAIKKEGQITLTKGRYLINGSIKLIDSQSIHLENGAWLIRKKNNSEPMVWIQGTYSSLTGSGKNSVIESEVNTPNGLIRIGHKNMTQSKKNVLHATLKDLRIKGKSYGGGNDNTIDKGIYMANPQHKGMASYFHTIHDLLISNVDIGIHLQGFSNANSIRNIVLEGIGNSQKDVGIWVNGAQENRISDIFHHHSSGVGATILVTDFKSSKRKYTASFNRVESVVSEPDADAKKAISRCLIFESEGTRNYFSLSENNINGNKVGKNFVERNNTLHSSSTGRSSVKNTIANQLTLIPSSTAPINSIFLDKKDSKLKFKDKKGKIYELTQFK